MKLCIHLLCFLAFGIAIHGASLHAESRPAKPRTPSAKKNSLSEFQTHWQARPELDRIFFVDDRYAPVQARVQRWNTKTLWIERGEQVLEFPLEQIRAIQLHDADDQKRETASLAYLREACEWRKPVLHHLDHHERSWFEFYLERLIQDSSDITYLADIQWARKFLMEDATDWQRYLDEWIKQRSQARDPKQSAELHEAKHFIDHGRWVPKRLMLHYLRQLATHEHQERLKLEEEHPKWHEDDEIKPARQRHFNLSIDMHLYASLFEADLMESSCHGLLEAGRIAHDTGDPTSARHWWQSLLHRYPSRPEAKEAQSLLRQLPVQEVKNNDTENSSHVPELPSDAEPPSLLRFSMFEE